MLNVGPAALTLLKPVVDKTFQTKDGRTIQQAELWLNGTTQWGQKTQNHDYKVTVKAKALEAMGGIQNLAMVRPGSQIQIAGYLTGRVYEYQGKQGITMEVVANKIAVSAQRPPAQQNLQQMQAQPVYQESSPSFDDIPF